MLNSIVIPSIDDMTRRSETPDYIKQTISRIRNIIEYDKRVYELLYKNNLVKEIINNKQKNPIEMKYHGSYKRNTSAFYFQKIEKSDIDIYLKIGEYHSSPSIFKNRHYIDKDFNAFQKQWSSGVYGNFRITDDNGSNGYVPIPNFASFKNDLSNYLSNVLSKECEVENANKVIRIKSGTLTIELAICGQFSLMLQNNAKGFEFYKRIKKYYSDKKIDEKVILVEEQHGFKIFGINIVTSNNKEIQNFPKVNDIFVHIKNDETSGAFSKYSRYFKNLIKLINQKTFNQIKLSSYHLECVLHSLEASHFALSNFDNEQLLIKNLIKQILLIDENKFNFLKEINGLILLSKKINFIDFNSSVKTLDSCLQLHY